MKTKKLTLDHLKIDSFITEIQYAQRQTINGAQDQESIQGICVRSWVNACPISPIVIKTKDVFDIPDSHNEGLCSVGVCINDDDALIPGYSVWWGICPTCLC